MAASLTTHNRFALGFLFVAKAIGVVGVILAFVGSRTLGGTLLALDAVLILAAVVISLRVMRSRTKVDDGHKAILAQMIREGTLEQNLRELQSESRAAKKLSA